MVVPNGTNAAKTATITFAAAGNYTLTAQIKDAQNQTATSSVAVIVAATPTTVDIQPRTAVVVVNTSKEFAAAVADQFGKPAATATPGWTTSGGGTIDVTGRFTAGAETGGPFTLTATAEGASGTAQIVVAEMEDTTPPAIAITSPANGAAVSGNAMIETDATDDLGIGRVVITVAGEDHELTASPWQHLWDTTALADGEYTIEARAYDLAGNPSAPVAITVLVQPGSAKEGGGCGCASSSGPSPWMLLALLALRRRRHAA
jgi:uncharacterized protein (TIGR03382 family)